LLTPKAGIAANYSRHRRSSNLRFPSYELDVFHYRDRGFQCKNSLKRTENGLCCAAALTNRGNSAVVWLTNVAELMDEGCSNLK
jgi:hypothetical protein